RTGTDRRFGLATNQPAFWKKENSYREQPRVAFKHSLFLLLEGTSTRSTDVPIPFRAAWSTDPSYNQIVREIVRTPTADVDENRDGKNDYLTFAITVPTFAGENVLHARDSVQLSMETMALLDYTHSLPASKLAVQGDLRIFQRSIFRDKGLYLDEEGPVANVSRAGTVEWTAELMVAEYMDRDGNGVRVGRFLWHTRVSHTQDVGKASLFLHLLAILTSNVTGTKVRTDLIALYPMWTSGRGPNEPFVITGKIRYSEDRI
ncbi:MAG: hypothetical protein BJ554DRAFT_2815, partial [Olpidium bornovanus]